MWFLEEVNAYHTKYALRADGGRDIIRRLAGRSGTTIFYSRASKNLGFYDWLKNPFTQASMFNDKVGKPQSGNLCL